MEKLLVLTLCLALSLVATHGTDTREKRDYDGSSSNEHSEGGFSGYSYDKPTSYQQPDIKEVTKFEPVHQTLKIPVSHPVQQPFHIPVPYKVLEPYQIQIPVPVTVEKIVKVPVEKIVKYPVEKLVPVKVVKKVPVPVPKPYPVPVPVYKTKYVYHYIKKYHH